MKTKINKVTYEIKEVERYSDGLLYEDRYAFGICDYHDNEIRLLETLSYERKRIMLMHELTHAFISEYGHIVAENFNQEQVCELFATFAEDVVDIANKYFEKKI